MPAHSYTSRYRCLLCVRVAFLCFSFGVSDIFTIVINFFTGSSYVAAPDGSRTKVVIFHKSV